ncbi:MAG: RNA polymerase sigma-54 factor [Candidatus Omnitrophota bacterium]|jgi:RNA polymerase sigma-54 factor|nr:MAG: RNA polymerase sigma-54 factor [Candidatus Omnitrophota bacterium]
MDQRLQLQQKMSQRLIMTPQMQQSIQLLQLSTLELSELMQEEMAENPMLEEEEHVDASQEVDFEESSQDNKSENLASDLAENGHIELDQDWENYFSDSSDIGYISSGTSYNGQDEEFTNVQMANEETLKDHLIWQLGISTENETEYRIGEYLIDQLDEDGFLKITVEEVAEIQGESVELIEKVLYIIHNFDPAGIGARTLSECLEIQCRHHDIDDDDILEVIRNHLDSLERKRYKDIARVLGVTEQHVQEIADIIGNFDPRPGRQYVQTTVEYITPDVFVERVDGEWQVRVNDEGAPPLRISKKYRDMLQNKNGITGEEYEFIKKKFQSAIWLIRNIEQRKRTLYRVTKAITTRQEPFLEEGVTSLKPLKLRDIADELGIHEATVCRVVNKKYVQTPRGLFELKYFFSTGLDTTGSDDMSAKSVMEIIRRLIDEENPKKPLSDQKLTEILHRDYELTIARRTVAKYREKMGILPTSKRKRV